jgi:hypothetical protein
VPAGPNTTCAEDRCVCCEEPPLCDSESFCRTAYEFCCEFEPCGERWVRPFDNKWQFCSCLDDVLETACITAEHACESESSMRLFVGMLSTLDGPSSERHPTVITTTTLREPLAGPYFLLAAALLLTIFCSIALYCFCCMSPNRQHRHPTHTTLAHFHWGGDE